MFKIAFLFDKDNDWIETFFPDKLQKLSHFSINKFYTPDRISGFDVVFALGYSKILSESFLKSNKLSMTVHESALPLGKGFAPTQWQIIEGYNEITVSLIELKKVVDSGDIYEQTKITFAGTELYEEIRRIQANATFDLIIKFLENYPNNHRIKQVGKESFYRKRTPKDSELDIDKTIRESFNLLRVCNNNDWPAFFQFKGKKYFLKIYDE